MAVKSITSNIPEEILPLAFQFREVELWNELMDSDVYAVQLSDKTIAYCCVMGHSGQHYALGIYFGTEGFRTYLDTINSGNTDLSHMEVFEVSVAFDCINIDFMPAEMMDSKIKRETSAWARGHGFKIHRGNGYPDPTRFYPGKIQWKVTDPKDLSRVCEVLSASIDLKKKLQPTSAFQNLGFDEKGEYPDNKGGKIVPLIVPTADGFSYSTTKLPKYVPMEYPSPEFDKDMAVMSLKALRKSGELYCRVIHMPMPVQESKNEPPYFPGMILVIKKNPEELLPTECAKSVYSHSEELVHTLAKAIRDIGTLPSIIRVEDNLSYSILKGFCKCLDIKLTQVKHASIIDNAWSMVFMAFSDGGMF